MSKQLGILFKPEMVRAILEGRKTQTRRGVKSDANNIYWNPIVLRGKYGWTDEHGYPVRCDWNVGDYLYVKETWWSYGYFEETGETIKSGKAKKKWKMAWEGAVFLDQGKPLMQSGLTDNFKWRKMSSLFLAQKDARIWLKVTNVRVERLLDISHADAIYEGVASMMHYDERVFYDYMSKGHDMDIDAIESYFSLWDSINGAGSHKENPWVFVIEFERCEKP